MENKITVMTIAIGAAMAAMVIDWVTGYIKASIAGHVQSAIGRRGIFKKAGLIMLIVASAIADSILVYITPSVGITSPYKGIVTLLVTVWITVNELLSILENLGECGVKLPKFLFAIISSLSHNIDNGGDDFYE